MRRATWRGLGLALAVALLACSGESSDTGAPAIRLLDSSAPITIANETRLASRVDPGTPNSGSLRASATLPTRAHLSVGFGIPDPVADDDRGPVEFSIFLETSDGEREPIYAHTLNPGQRSGRRWANAEIDLARWDGREVTLEFVAENADGATDNAAWSDPTVTSEHSQRARQNVLILSLDTLRARNMSAYGYGRDTTPFIDEFAASGVLFETAITASVTTGPSHMSLFTGLYPVRHGLRTGMDWKAPEAITTATRFREAGYSTAAFTENGYILRPRGFGEGFAEYTENPGQHGRAPGHVRLTFTQAQRWLRRNVDRPFFLFVHTYQVHAPYNPPNGYAKLFENDGFTGPEDPTMRQLRDDYDREIRFVDDQVRELMNTVDVLGLRDSTLVVIVSDHGEEFAEHGLYQHGSAVYEETLRVPLIFRGTEVSAGRRYSTAVSLVDVMPTLLELANLAIPERLDGASLASAVRGHADPEERTIFSEARARQRWLRPLERERWNPPLISVRSGDSKFIVHRPDRGDARAPVHFDLSEDALERTPRPVEGERLNALNALVDGYLEGSVASDGPGEESLTPEQRENLRLLGYLE